MPLYSAVTPPSVLYIVTMVDHMPGSLVGFARAAKEADWMDRRVRTISSGYVNVTDVMPAMPPQVKRARGDRSAPGVVSKKCCTSKQSQREHGDIFDTVLDKA